MADTFDNASEEKRDEVLKGKRGASKKAANKKPRGMNHAEILKEYRSEQELFSSPTVAVSKRSGSFSSPVASRNSPSASVADRRITEDKLTTPKNGHQEAYVRQLKNKECKIVLATGPAGTGKTVFACDYGIYYFFCGIFEKLIFTRPLVSVDEEIGFLPGTIEEKMAPWVRPIYDILGQYISMKEITHLMDEKHIEIVPLGFMRGRTFKNTWIVADEMQNSSVSQMKMLLTRVGTNSRLVITGDLQQCDRWFPANKHICHEKNGLEDFLGRLHYCERKYDSIYHVEFEKSDIQREPVVQDVLNIYDDGI